MDNTPDTLRRGPVPDWDLPVGVDRGLWDYLASEEMVNGYDNQMAVSPLAATDVKFCEAALPQPGRLIDLGCGTGRLCVHFARRGFDCLGVDLSELMLAKSAANAKSAGVRVEFRRENLVDLAGIPDASFDYAACLFSTLGMIRGNENREAALRSAARVVKPGGTLVLHAHNRGFRGLGWKRFLSPEITTRQAYGGAPLTLRHFTRNEINRLLFATGWQMFEVMSIGIDDRPPRGGGRTYGFLFAARRQVS